MPRPRLLRTCGESFMALGQKAYTRAQHFDGRLGKLANRIDKLVIPTTPFIYTVQHQFLAVLSFADDQILFFEDLVEKFIPQSAEVFNRIDNLVHVVEMIPRNCDDVMNEFAIILQQGTIFDWAMTYFIFGLDCLIATFLQWGSSITADDKTKYEADLNRKEVARMEYDDYLHDDIKKCGKDDHLAESPMSLSPKSCCSEEPTNTAVKSFTYKEILESPSNFEHEPFQNEIKKSGNEESLLLCPSNEYRTAMKCSYKEILEKGGKESNDTRETFTVEENIGEERNTTMNKNDEGVVSEDPILELFESSWHLSPVKGNSFPRSFLQP